MHMQAKTFLVLGDLTFYIFYFKMLICHSRYLILVDRLLFLLPIFCYDLVLLTVTMGQLTELPVPSSVPDKECLLSSQPGVARLQYRNLDVDYYK